MRKANIAQKDEWMPIKRFARGFGTVPSQVGALTNREGFIRLLHRYHFRILLVMLAVTVSFEVTVVLQFISAAHILPLGLGITLGGTLLSLLFLSCVKMLPHVGDASSLREINVADLLERDVVSLQISEAHAVLNRQIILVTGAAGSIGSELCRQLLGCEPKALIALDTNETGLFDLAESVRSHPYAALLHPYIGDISDLQDMTRLFEKEQPKIIFHAAAYKHVPLLEQFPDRAIHTNTLATYHLCRLAMQHGVARFLFISTDKAAEPTSVMGASKRVGELIIQALSKSVGCTTCFCAVRFGNVIGSRGSVVPLFAQQIKRGGPVTVTDPEATRYFMTTPEACGLVIITAATADQGGLYLLDMGNPVRIIDLAKKMIQMRGFSAGSDIPIVYTGLRPGERLHEILVATNEELIPTVQSKIFCVNRRGNLPTLTSITRWMDILECSLKYESSTQLRAHLIEIAWEQESIVLVD